MPLTTTFSIFAFAFPAVLAAPMFQKRGTQGAAYVQYSGNGASWPSSNTWVSSFDDMFNANRAIMQGSCNQWQVPNNSEGEMSAIHDGINTVAGETGLDARFILAVLLQESNGCVRAPTTNNGVRNPGLMQDHNGAATCNEGGNVSNPCPASTITQMIRDGVAGTPAGDGLKQTYAKAPGAGAQKYYGAARIYNSGSIDASGDLNAGIATHCYSSDIANRLLGWTFQQKTCTQDGIVPQAPADPVPAVAPAPAPAPASTPTPAPAPAPASAPVPPPAPESAPASSLPPSVPASALAQESTPAPAPAPVQESAPAPLSTKKASSNNMAPGVTTECAEYYTVQGGDYCNRVAQKFGTSFAVLRQLNTQLDSQCSNLWKGYDYCVRSL